METPAVSRNPFAAFAALNATQRRTFIAAYLGWTLDAFDFFLVVFVVSRVATEFNESIPTVAFAITVTLALRPLGALIFGRLADRFGRRTPYMVNIFIYSVVELLTAFSPNFTTFLILRAIYGVAMGGVWGVGAALALEALPTKTRGLFSGILQQGYAVGYLLAAVAYFLIFPHFGWRGMFIIGVAPALLVIYIWRAVPESQVWIEGKEQQKIGQVNIWTSFLKQPGLYIYAIVLMAAFNFMSHGSQDLYPTFLQKQKDFGIGTVTSLAIIANLGAIAGGIFFGALSQHFGRRRSITLAASLGILMIPLWVFSPNILLLGLGAFLLQVFVQGAWGVVPVHLNELSPAEVRGTFPGFTYQLGNLISAGAAQMEAAFAGHFPAPGGGANYAEALAIIMLVVFLAVAILAAVGPERRSIEFAPQAAA
jgi:SHS family lactate transporter-like MFS transporter